MRPLAILALLLPLSAQQDGMRGWAGVLRQPTTVYWRLDGEMPAALNRSDVEAQIQADVSEWGRYLAITFKRAQTAGQNRTIEVSFGAPRCVPIVGKAHAHYPQPVEPEPLAGDIHLDESDNWTLVMLHDVLLHEIGHALGIEHIYDQWSVMYPFLGNGKRLTLQDINAARGLYLIRGWPITAIRL